MRYSSLPAQLLFKQAQLVWWSFWFFTMVIPAAEMLMINDALPQQMFAQ